MTDTALRAGAQSATGHKESVAYGNHPYDSTHMVFANKEHEKFYYEKLKQARYQDCYHKALIYVLGISEDTRNHFSQIYDMKSGYIKPECLHQGWQTSGSVRVVRLAFNLYTDGMPSVDDYEGREEQLNECNPIRRIGFEYIRERYFLLWLRNVLLAGHHAPLSGILPETEVH